jgi:hypothetical protein
MLLMSGRSELVKWGSVWGKGKNTVDRKKTSTRWSSVNSHSNQKTKYESEIIATRPTSRLKKSKSAEVSAKLVLLRVFVI